MLRFWNYSPEGIGMDGTCGAIKQQMIMSLHGTLMQTTPSLTKKNKMQQKIEFY